MQKIKLLAVLFIVCGLVVSLSLSLSCEAEPEVIVETVVETVTETVTETVVETVEAEDGSPHVALLWLGAQTPYGPPFIANFQFLANEMGWQSTIFDGKFDAALQASQMDDSIGMNPDVIDLVALDAAGMAPGIKKAFDAGIAVLMDHTPANEEDRQYTVGYTGPENYVEGLVAGELMNDALGGEGKIVIITGAAGQEAAISRPQGLKDKLVELNSNIEVLAEQTAGWDKAQANQVMADFITRYGDDIDGVFAADDTMAVGAWIALEEAGYNVGDLVIIGIGGSREGLAAIDSGIVYGTVMQDPVTGSSKAIDTIKLILEQGIKPPNQLDPYQNLMDHPSVTKDNVADYLPGNW